MARHTSSCTSLRAMPSLLHGESCPALLCPLPMAKPHTPGLQFPNTRLACAIPLCSRRPDQCPAIGSGSRRSKGLVPRDPRAGTNTTAPGTKQQIFQFVGVKAEKGKAEPGLP